MDLLFSKYASPFVLLEQMISLNRLSEFVYEFLSADNDRKLWEMYLSCVANPMSDVGSFEDFKEKCTKQSTSQNISESELEATIQNSNNILNNFDPTREGGEVL